MDFMYWPEDDPFSFQPCAGVIYSNLHLFLPGQFYNFLESPLNVQ